MALRLFLYYAVILDKYLLDTESNLDKSNKKKTLKSQIYKKELIKLPKPEFYIFYNGKENWDKKILRLSDSFKKSNIGFTKKTGFENGVELVVDIINIRYENNNELIRCSKPLEDYSTFVYLVQSKCLERIKNNPNEDKNKIRREVLNEVYDYCIKNNIMKEYLEEKGRPDMIGYMNKELELQGMLEDAEEIGEAKGIEKGIEQGIEKGIEKGIEQGIEKGIEQGIVKGIEKGIEQGVLKGKIEMMIEDNYNDEDIMKRLSKYDINLELIEQVRNSL